MKLSCVMVGICCFASAGLFCFKRAIVASFTASNGMTDSPEAVFESRRNELLGKYACTHHSKGDIHLALVGKVITITIEFDLEKN